MSEYDDDFDTDAFLDNQQSQPTLPLRTFRVLVDRDKLGYVEEIVQAVSYAVECDVAKFFSVKPTNNGELMLVNHRSLRPFVDVEDITGLVAAGSQAVN